MNTRRRAHNILITYAVANFFINIVEVLIFFIYLFHNYQSNHGGSHLNMNRMQSDLHN